MYYVFFYSIQSLKFCINFDVQISNSWLHNKNLPQAIKYQERRLLNKLNISVLDIRKMIELFHIQQNLKLKLYFIYILPNSKRKF